MNGLRSIPLVARDGWAISNSIDPHPSAQTVEFAQMHARLLLAQVEQLKGPSGQYNCHGLVFAVRRTNIPAVAAEFDVDELLAHDGYRPLANGLPAIGDVAVYRDDRGDIEHTGIVCGVDRVGIQPVVHVWSMWGGLGEFRHRADQTPYSQRIEYWRLA
jgi:hypothetical protein